MREIKFKAWAFDDEFMVDESYDGDDFVFTMDNGEPKLLEAKFDQINQAVTGYGECNHKMLQYTGLKDKNGVEIYEGDVVAKKGMDCNSEEYRAWMTNKDYSDNVDSDLESKIPIINKVVDVVTMERFPTYWLKNESFGYEGEDLEGPSCFEVIGNIYENPELIQK